MVSGTRVVVSELEHVTPVLGNRDAVVDVTDRTATSRAIASGFGQTVEPVDGGCGGIAGTHRWRDTVEQTTQYLKSICDGNL
jgi:hypothetical protein